MPQCNHGGAGRHRLLRTYLSVRSVSGAVLGQAVRIAHANPTFSSIIAFSPTHWPLRFPLAGKPQRSRASNGQ